MQRQGLHAQRELCLQGMSGQMRNGGIGISGQGDGGAGKTATGTVGDQPGGSSEEQVERDARAAVGATESRPGHDSRGQTLGALMILQVMGGVRVKTSGGNTPKETSLNLPPGLDGSITGCGRRQFSGGIAIPT